MSKMKQRIGLGLQFALTLAGYATLLLFSSPKAHASTTVNGEWVTGPQGNVCDCTSNVHTCYCIIQK